ncbi:hypothetical protein BO79DRAFT_231441 [Aspergillus costaricaensis CBS 115574]|uniref:Uncharacterized protein n=1 Tax=Aspergillus costaricaensis CBS 115574 TaxID=1448317 RepID=A0ACD1I684_9EURO|nr:hypothetical protein BO79DRAFT_231441 [Aspergillus costaricaensis CBS 115574]RAK85510.1 hypothetical protein BO79DRAFT_231441 [Aspergillus costaricaensis CBS 115574]
MATTITLPYYARDIPCPLPTTSEIDAAPDISLEYGGRRIVEIGDHLVAKFGKGVDLIEGENMLFVQENTSIRVPRVYALYSDPSTGKNYIVAPKNKTVILLCAISDPPPFVVNDRMCTAANSRLARKSFPLHFRKMANASKLDVLALQNIISSASGHSISKLQSITKLTEGGYNRVFEATFSDGKSVLARLPYPSTVPEHYTVASETATLDYLRLHELRTPEKLDGTPLGDKWFSLTPQEQYKIMTQIVEWETRLMSLEFPASRSLYYSKDLPSEKRTKLDDPSSMAFCIGPIAHYSWWHGERGIMDIDRGPWPSSVDIFRAVGERELTWAKAYAMPRLPYERLYREVYQFKRVSPDTHVTDLPNNILVSDTNGITGLIDWQHCAILPLGIVSGIPAHFQNYGDPESEMLKQSQLNLPSDYDSMTPSKQNSVKEIYRRRLIHFLYAALTKRLNQDHYDAIFDQSVILRQGLLQSAGRPWEGDSVSLRAELIRSILNWSAIVQINKVAPPVDYPEDVVRETVDLNAQQREAYVAMKQMRHALVVDIMGWVPNEDYEAARRLASEIKSRMLEAAETPAEHDSAAAQILNAYVGQDVWNLNVAIRLDDYRPKTVKAQ